MRKIKQKTKERFTYILISVATLLIFIGCAEICSLNGVVAEAESNICVEVTDNTRYADIEYESWELDELAAVIYLEVRNQSEESQHMGLK